MTRSLIFIFLLCVIFPATLTAQKDTANQRWSIGAEFNRDYLLYQNSSSFRPGFGWTITWPYYGINTYTNADCVNISFGLNVKVRLLKWLFFDTRLNYVQYKTLPSSGKINSAAISIYNNVMLYQIRYLDIPVGLSFIMKNKGRVHPFLNIGLSNQFSFHMKAYGADGPIYKWFEENKLRYHSLKLRSSIGLDFSLNKWLTIGNECFFITHPIWQTKKSLVIENHYATISFSIHAMIKI